MKKIMCLVVALMALFALTSCSFFGLSCDQARTNLEEAGYNVTVIDGMDFDYESCPVYSATIIGSEIDKYLVAEKGDDVIYMWFFYFLDDASDEYTFMSHKTFKSGQNNNVVYFGTKQAIKDSKI